MMMKKSSDSKAVKVPMTKPGTQTPQKIGVGDKAKGGGSDTNPYSSARKGNKGGK